VACAHDEREKAEVSMDLDFQAANTDERALNTRVRLEADDKRYLWHPFTQQQDWELEPQTIIDRAEGHYLIDLDGKRYLDGVSSLWVNVHGHRQPQINAAIVRQLERVAHSTFLGLTHQPGIELARRLIDLAPAGLRRVFYSDTGAAAVEIALKMAFQYWQQANPPRPAKSLFLSLRNAYHGDTVGAMSVGGMAIYRETYRPLLFPTLGVGPEGIAPLQDIERVMAEHAAELAAVILEPLVQGAAGMVVYPPGYTRHVWELARRHDVLFIADEVATGFGRTGTMFACEHEGIEPDLMALGKGMTGGYLPLAATLATEQIYRAFLGNIEEGRTFYHGHTYTGNPLACAAALANLDLFQQNKVLEHLRTKIEQLRSGLERFGELTIVGDIRQCGFMVGIDLVADSKTGARFPVGWRVGVRVMTEARGRGVIVRPLGDVVVLMPPLSMTPMEIDTLLSTVYDSIRQVAEVVMKRTFSW
jgi:adenosylmethionine-8-amino-7-oxononanoate aminotransferase